MTQTKTDSGASTKAPVYQRPRKSKTPWVVGLILVLGGAAAIWFALQGSSTESADEETVAEPLEFEEAVRTDLEEVSEYEGTIGQLEGDPMAVRMSGTVTALPEVGDTIGQGDVIVWIDNEPVVLLYGDVPVWRTMRDDDIGPDIFQLETALVALGFDEDGDMTLDEEFTYITESVVELWQEAIGAPVDEIVNLGEVVFSAEPVVVDTLLVEVGDVINDGTAVFTTSAGELEIEFDLPTTQQDSLAVGDQVEVTMPDLTVTTGTVEEISTIATSTAGAGQATLDVVVSLDDPSVAEGIDEAPVTISVITDRVTDVVAVPVEALLALSEGGYAVEVAIGSGTQLVPVETGFYASGLIEVIGDIAPGDQVVVP